ncbi:MAG: DUF308 domain-containing protein, partial [Pseudobutyrivibrio sp.]|nr:DUF308 domain-containing protein [Pseudobutyrivibrio sp.]
VAANIIGAIAFLAAGICLLTLNADFIARLVYSFLVLGFGILFICFGTYYMIKYFFNHEFARITSYSFTMGVILVIIGAVFIMNANYVSAFIDALVCLLGVVFGAIMLQQSFALFHIGRGTWFLSLLLGAATVAGSIYLLLVPMKIFDGNLYTSIYLILVGAFSLFSLLLMVIGLRDHKKDANRIYNRNMEESPLSSKKKADESIFEEEPVVEIKEEKKEEPEAGSDALFEE